MPKRRSLLRGLPAGLVAVAGCQQPSEDAATTGTQPEGSPDTSGIPPGDLSVTWERAPDLPLRRTQTSAVALGGRLYVLGGIVEEGERHTAVFDPDRGDWRTVAPPPEPVNHTATVTLDGRIHVLGGYTGSFLGSDPRAVHWVYDPGTGEWTDAPPLPTPRGAMVALVVGGRVHAIGGADATGTTNVVEVYDPETRRWSTGPTLPTPREHLAAGVVGGQGYAAGGRQGLSPMVGATACYDAASESWASRRPMPTPRAGIAGAVAKKNLFVAGGEEVGERVFGAVEAYHPPGDRWRRVTLMPTPRWGIGAATLHGSVYFVGGGAVPGGEETRRVERMVVE